MMKQQKMILFGVGTIVILVIVGVVFLFWHRSQANAIQVESAKQFESEPASQEIPLEQVPEGEMVEEKKAELVQEEKADAAKPSAEEKKRGIKRHCP